MIQESPHSRFYIFTFPLNDTPAFDFTAIAPLFYVDLRLNLNWCSFSSWSGTSQERRAFWCRDRDRLSLWQPRQLALIISANGKMRGRFFASPTSDSSSPWQLRRRRAAGRMFTQPDYGKCEAAVNGGVWLPIPAWLIAEFPAAAPLSEDRNCLSLACVPHDNVPLLNLLSVAQTRTDTPAGPSGGKHWGS